MIDELEAFERRMKQALGDFLDPVEAKRRKRPTEVGKAREGLRVRLAVREKRLAMDTVFVFESTSISKLQAQIEAGQAARAAGYPIVGYVIDYEEI